MRRFRSGVLRPRTARTRAACVPGPVSPSLSWLFWPWAIYSFLAPVILALRVTINTCSARGQADGRGEPDAAGAVRVRHRLRVVPADHRMLVRAGVGLQLQRG